MIQVAPQMRVLVAVQPADFRKGIDGLAKLAREELAQTGGHPPRSVRATFTSAPTATSPKMASPAS
jgi:hypothetical protein